MKILNQSKESQSFIEAELVLDEEIKFKPLKSRELLFDGRAAEWEFIADGNMGQYHSTMVQRDDKLLARSKLINL